MHALLLAATLAQATPPASSLTLSATSVNLNPAQQQVVTVAGAAPPLQVALDRRLVNVEVSPDGSTITVTATQATGSDVLHVVDAAGAQADVSIRVAFNAGTIVPQQTLRVTGDPADPQWLAQEVQNAVLRATKAQPDSTVTLGATPAISSALAPGESTQVEVPVQIAGHGRYFDQSGATVVNIENVAASPFQPGILFYSDDPEHVTQDGLLFRGTVTTATPARLYYYHDDAQDPRRLVVLLSGAADEPASVQVVGTRAGPNMDVMHVGHTVSKNFLLTKTHHEGLIVDLSPDDPFVLADVPMSARQLVAGNVDVRVLSGGPVTVAVVAASPGVDPRTLLGGPQLPDDGHHRTGTFQIAAYGNEALNYMVGGADPTVVIGDTDPTPPSADPQGQGHDYGDYGVVHTIDVTMRNPAAEPATAYLYFKPLAGPARASFLLDGNLIELGCVRVSAPYQISSVNLAPGESYRGTLLTMPDGGSFFPTEIGITATPPQPHAPPISAPDGCFPKPDAGQSP
ncbi:MAG: hypothetical protein JO350_09930 [Candidatus Eremiobacteraeota bacterium]|nr:hypothetical protein [Candidatus Eremiobacteraeota bacterium]